MRKAVAKARKQHIAVFVAKIVEQINEQHTVAHHEVTRTPRPLDPNELGRVLPTVA
jgi:hypothetical protein